MILLDTHIWIWWIQGDPQLKADREIYPVYLYNPFNLVQNEGLIC